MGGTVGAVTNEAIRRWHLVGIAPGRANVEQIRVLCAFYSEQLGRPITLDEIHPILAARWGATRRIAITSRYPGQAA